jgi:phosphatidylcholine synthase
MASSIWMPISASVMLISSALYYGKKNMVEQDQYFIGFPVLWNFVVFFQFFVFQNTLWLNVLSVIFFGILHFIPLRFAYPSRSKRFFKVHLLVSVFGLIAALGILFIYPNRMLSLEIIAGGGGIYFFLFAFYDTIFSAR